MKPSKNGEIFCDSNPTEKEKKTNEKPKVISSERIEECLDPIRVLVLWTQNAENTGLNTNDVINTAIAQFNSCIYRSNITSAAAITLAGSQKVNFTETNTILSDWNTLAESANNINGVIKGLRDASNADIVILMTNSNYGIYQGTIGNFSMNANSAYAIVQINNAVGSEKVFAHEIGHLFDARHKVDNQNNPQVYAHSHVIVTPWYSSNCNTIMHFNSDNRIENFSNPNVYVSGIATGLANTNDNARRILETWQTVRNHKPSASTLSTSIYGVTYCNLFQSYTWEAATRCAQGFIGYEWFTSYDGFNWYLRGTNEFYSEYFYSGANTYRFLKLRVTANGQVSESFTTIYLHNNGQGNRVSTSDDKSAETYVPPVVGKKSENDIEPEKVNLVINQIFPNPSQATFSLNFTNPIEQDVSLDLIDASGHTVNLFAKERYSKGNYSKNLTAGNLSSGTYIVRLSSDSEFATTKLVIIK
jgi:hypothetical protein